MALEYERVKSIKIREMLSNSEIKYINGITKEEVTIKEFIHRLNPNSVTLLYQQMCDFRVR
jgi:hypothetical protein